MTTRKETLNGLYKEYNEILSMTQEQVIEKYEETKEVMLSCLEVEIDEYESEETGITSETDPWMVSYRKFELSEY